MKNLNVYRQKLKEYGITSINLADQEKCSRQNISTAFKNYSKPFLCYQKHMLDKAIDAKIDELRGDFEVIRSKIKALSIMKTEIKETIEGGEEIGN